MRSRPRLLDLFCGAGGAAKGYDLAGFDVVGVDIVPQKNYPFEMIVADACEYPLEGFDVVHASPPCQDHMRFRAASPMRGTGWMLEHTLGRLRASEKPWVVENVMGAPLPSPIVLCGASFGLGIPGFDLARHRQFSSPVPLMGLACVHRPGRTIGVYGSGTNRWHLEKLGRGLTVADKRLALGIDWMTGKGLAQAIPPLYAWWVGIQVLRTL